MSTCTNLTGTKWYFNLILTEPPKALRTSNPQINFFVQVATGDTGTGNWGYFYDKLRLWRMVASGNVYGVEYHYTDAWTIVWDSEFAWRDSDNRRIVITGGPDAQNQTLIDWIEANATQVTLDPQLTISYNGQTIYDSTTTSSFSSGTVYTLPTLNKFMLTNIEVYSKDIVCRITYNQTTIINTVGWGTFTLLTSKKRGNSNIYIQEWFFSDSNAIYPPT